MVWWSVNLLFNGCRPGRNGVGLIPWGGRQVRETQPEAQILGCTAPLTWTVEHQQGWEGAKLVDVHCSVVIVLVKPGFWKQQDGYVTVIVRPPQSCPSSSLFLALSGSLVTHCFMALCLAPGLRSSSGNKLRASEAELRQNQNGKH